MPRILITGGFIVSGDPDSGTLPVADLLIEDGTIRAIGPNLAESVRDAERIDAAGTIVIPGFVDTHRHTWETVARGLYATCTLDAYLADVVGNLGPNYDPEDVYAGNLLGALEALNAGITMMLDWSHCNNTPEHADAGIRGLQESGMRAVYAYGNQSGPGIWG